MPILPHDDSLTAQDHFLASVGISFSLQAYLHNVPAEFTRGITIWAASLCKYSEGKEVRIKVIPSIIPRPEELVEHENAIECVFVGMTLSYGRIRDMAAAKDQAEQAGTKRKKEKGLAALDLEGDVEVIATDPEALRVVAKKSGRTATFYALANPNERSLCMGIVVPGEDVFFFEAVRDDSVTSYQGRKDSFARKIRDLMAGRLTSAPAEANGCKRRKVKNEKNELAWSSAVRDFIEREPTMLVAKATVMNLVSLLENSLITGNIGGVHLSLQILRDLGNKPKEAVTAGCFLGAFVAPRQAGPAVSEHVFSLLKVSLMFNTAIPAIQHDLDGAYQVPRLQRLTTVHIAARAKPLRRPRCHHRGAPSHPGSHAQPGDGPAARPDRALHGGVRGRATCTL